MISRRPDSNVTQQQPSIEGETVRECPSCPSGLLERSHRRVWEYPLSLFGFLPYRCDRCLERTFQHQRLKARVRAARRSEPPRHWSGASMDAHLLAFRLMARMSVGHIIEPESPTPSQRQA